MTFMRQARVVLFATAVSACATPGPPRVSLSSRVWHANQGFVPGDPSPVPRYHITTRTSRPWSLPLTESTSPSTVQA